MKLNNGEVFYFINDSLVFSQGMIQKKTNLMIGEIIFFVDESLVIQQGIIKRINFDGWDIDLNGVTWRADLTAIEREINHLRNKQRKTS